MSIADLAFSQWTPALTDLRDQPFLSVLGGFLLLPIYRENIFFQGTVIGKFLLLAGLLERDLTVLCY